MERYDLRYMAEVFKKDAMMIALEKEKFIEYYLKTYPGEDLPDWVRDKYNHATALYSIVKHIDELEDEVKDM